MEFISISFDMIMGGLIGGLIGVFVGALFNITMNASLPKFPGKK